ncbi:MAG: VWA domain-containing protein [Cenarchaeum sp. SB0667_bin_13]|nr:VWA domain-containing protein [Cenarchaeum sp. SB0667_bin_13]
MIQSMFSHNVYTSANAQITTQQNDEYNTAQNYNEKLLEKLSMQALKDKNSIKDMQGTFAIDDNAKAGEITGDGKATIKRLYDMGYIRDEKKWLTKKGFDAIGRMILRKIMQNARSLGTGEHSTNLRGDGEITMDTTRKYEYGDDPKNLSVHDTLLNSILNNKTSRFPLNITTSDMAVYETYSDTRAAIVYCIDLSSTMKTKMKDGTSRMESAKRALWGLYGANRRFFPTDSVYIVGFASMAARILPYDIPYLRAFDADEFLHYTNYQAALRLSRTILRNNTYDNKKIVLITDGQPSACYVDSAYQKDVILSEKPYSNFYSPEPDILNRINTEKNIRLDTDNNRQVYLCYRYKKVDSRIHAQTIKEAAVCRRDDIDIDTVVITDEPELVEYGQKFAKETHGTMFHASDGSMADILVRDYMGRSPKAQYGL